MRGRKNGAPPFDKLAWQREQRHRDSKICRRRDKEYRARQKNKVFDKFGRRCSNPECKWINADGTRGCTDESCLQIDHVFNDGYKERKTVARTTLYNKVLADIEGRYQILCANCNWIKKDMYERRNKN